MYIDASTLYGYAMSESLLYDEIIFDKNAILIDTLNTLEDSHVGFFEVGIKSSKTKKNKEFSLLPRK